MVVDWKVCRSLVVLKLCGERWRHKQTTKQTKKDLEDEFHGFSYRNFFCAAGSLP